MLVALGLAARVAPAQTATLPDSGLQANASTEALRPGPRERPLRIGVSEVQRHEVQRHEVQRHEVQRHDGTGVVSSGQDRPRAVEYSEWYYRRQTVHRYASVLTVPLFVAQYLAGEELLKHRDGAASWAKNAHPALASGIQALFVLNTVAGAWNWWDTRAEPAGRVQRTIHAVAMLAADVGFMTIGEAEDEGEGGGSNNGLQQHRRHAIVSMSVATAGYLLMALPFWRN